MFQVGKLSTGDSLDMCPQDEASIIANDAVVKDMEVNLYSGTLLQILINNMYSKFTKMQNSLLHDSS